MPNGNPAQLTNRYSSSRPWNITAPSQVGGNVCWASGRWRRRFAAATTSFSATIRETGIVLCELKHAEGQVSRALIWSTYGNGG